MTYVINVKDIIGAAILCALAVATLILFAVAVIGEKVRQYQQRKIDAAYKEEKDDCHSV
jgi:predicted histidine transporter YuiF (NhaC family)